MPSVIRSLAWTVAWLASLAGAYWGGWQSASPGIPEPPARQASVSADQDGRTSPSKPRPASTSEAAEPDTEESAQAKTLARLHAVMAISPAEMPQAFARYTKSKEKQLELLMLAARWAETDPHAAFQAALALDPDTQATAAHFAFGGVLATWSRQEPLAAFAAYQEHLAGRELAIATEEAFFGLASANPARALAELTKRSGDYGYSNVSRQHGVANALLQRYPLDQSLQLLDEHPDPNIAQKVRRELLIGWAQSDFDTASETVAATSRSEGNPNLLLTFAGAGLASYPEESMAWAQRIDAESGNHALTTYATTIWIGLQPERAETWVRNLPDRTTRAALMEALNLKEEP